MKNNKILLALLCIIPLTSCNPGNEIRIEDFPVTLEMSGIEVKMSKPYMFVDMVLADSFLILSPVFQDNHQIHIYNKESFELIKTAGVVGRGPGEVINPGLCYVNDSTMMVWLTDMGRRSVLGFSIRDIIENDFSGFNTTVLLPESIFVIARFQAHHDTIFSYADAARPEYLISFFDTAQTLRDSLSVPDQLDLYQSGEVAPDRRMIQFNYFYSFNKKGDRIAVAYRYSDVITILDKRGKILKKVTGPDFIEQIPGESDKEVLTYQCLCTDDRYIWAAYKNKPRFDEETNSIPQFAATIHVFDWNGKPIARLVTDHPVSSVVVDRDNGRIVTFCPGTSGFVWYEIPEILR
jgi:hypothetical protein